MLADPYLLDDAVNDIRLGKLFNGKPDNPSVNIIRAILTARLRSDSYFSIHAFMENFEYGILMKENAHFHFNLN